MTLKSLVAQAVEDGVTKDEFHQMVDQAFREVHIERDPLGERMRQSREIARKEREVDPDYPDGVYIQEGYKGE